MVLKLIKPFPSSTVITSDTCVFKLKIKSIQLPKFMEDGTESEAVLPARGHVEDPNIGIWLRDPAGPHLQGFGAGHHHVKACVWLSVGWSTARSSEI